jgi:CRP-like cAMP-binding protein
MANHNSKPLPSPIFTSMSAAEREQVLALLETQTYQGGDTILREGESTQRLWIIVSGRCEVFILRSDRTENRLATLEPGAVFGEMSFFHPAPHSATVRAETEVEVMRLTRQKFDQLHELSPGAACKIAANTAGIIAERLRRMDKWVRDFVENREGETHPVKEEWEEFRAKLYSDWQF